MSRYAFIAANGNRSVIESGRLHFSGTWAGSTTYGLYDAVNWDGEDLWMSLRTSWNVSPPVEFTASPNPNWTHLVLVSPMPESKEDQISDAAVSAQAQANTALGMANLAASIASSGTNAVAVIQNRVIDVRDYGAVCDGATNDAPAIQSAIDSLTAGGIVRIPALCAIGTTGWTGISISNKQDITIEGIGGNAGFKILARPSQVVESGACAILVYNGTHCALRDLSVDGNGVDTIGLGMDMCHDSIIERCRVQNTANNAIMCVGGFDNRYLRNVVRNTTNTGRGMWIGNTNVGKIETRAVIAENTITNTGATGIGGTLKESSIIGNTVTDTKGSGIAMGCWGTGLYANVTISGNICLRNLYQGIQTDSSGAPYYLKGIVISNNVCNDNADAGIWVRHTMNVVVSGNVCRNNTSAGITVYNNVRNISVIGNVTDEDRTPAVQNSGILVNSADVAGYIDNLALVGNVCHRNYYQIRFTAANNGTLSRSTIVGNVCDADGQGYRGISYLSTAQYDFVATGNVAKGHVTFDIASGAGVVPSGAYQSCNIGRSNSSMLPAKLGSSAVGESNTFPSSGTWTAGDRIVNTVPGIGKPAEWVCTASGSPGTWIGNGTLAPNGYGFVIEQNGTVTTPPPDPKQAAVSYPPGGGDIRQWDVLTQSWL